MTIPMPYTEAPPHPGRSPKFSGDDVGHEERLAAREAWDDARWKYTESIVVGRDKHLTGVECADEFWSAWRNILRYDHGDPGRGEAIQQANTWLRFATHPHALEEA